MQYFEHRLGEQRLKLRQRLRWKEQGAAVCEDKLIPPSDLIQYHLRQPPPQPPPTAIHRRDYELVMPAIGKTYP